MKGKTERALSRPKKESVTEKKEKIILDRFLVNSTNSKCEPVKGKFGSHMLSGFQVELHWDVHVNVMLRMSWIF